jgi:superfamily II DNA or RNA helicase
VRKATSAELLALSEAEHLLHHNLETREFWSKKDLAAADGDAAAPGQPAVPVPASWVMTKGIKLYPWQEECVNRWLAAKRGTIKVVTGAGKTILALAIVERLQAQDRELRVAIVVPTVVLQDQWYKEILRTSNLPPQLIGRLGGGYRDDFSGDVRILICVLKSASELLASRVERSGVGRNLLLVADECHRAGAPDMRKVFQTRRAYSLGLSATPEREDAGDDLAASSADYDSSLLGQELGPIIYELTVHQALEEGILPEFEVHHIGLPLTGSERERYEQLSRRLRSVTSELVEVGHQVGIHDPGIARRAQALAARDDQVGMVARELLFLTNERKHLLYNAKPRMAAVSDILKREFREDKATRAILFHESIESVMLLYRQLLEEGFPVAVEHSQLPDSLREASIEFFRQGVAKIIVSARSLIEGFNVPETDIGIIVASSASVRQRIQTIGRLLRRGRDRAKLARIYVLYMQDTVDEVIYGKEDWHHLLGARRNRYFVLKDDGQMVEVEEPPRSPLPREEDIAPQALTVGEEYPGAYEGVEYTCDSVGNVFTTSRELVRNPQGVPEIIRRIKGSFGRFKVTPKQRYILALVPHGEEWVVMFCGQLPEPFQTSALDVRSGPADPIPPRELQLGDEYPQELVGDKFETIAIKQRGGRAVLAKKEGKGERFARVGSQAQDHMKGRDAEKLLEACGEFRLLYPGLTKFIITESKHVVALTEGVYRYVCTLEAGLEFP